jgi:hypothetical protein
MPRMRKFRRSPGPSYSAAKPTRRRCGRKSHHSLQSMPSANSSSCRDSHTVRARQGMRETMLTEFASRETTVRRFLHDYRSWIGSKLRCRMEEAPLGVRFPYLPRDPRRRLCPARARQLEGKRSSGRRSEASFQRHVSRGIDWQLRNGSCGRPRCRSRCGYWIDNHGDAGRVDLRSIESAVEIRCDIRHPAVVAGHTYMIYAEPPDGLVAPGGFGIALNDTCPTGATPACVTPAVNASFNPRVRPREP